MPVPPANSTTIIVLMQSDPGYLTSVQAKLTNRGLSPAAAEFITKTLHPVVGSPVQIPDPVSISTVNPEYRIEQTFTAPPAYLTNSVNWDLLIISPPSDRIAFYYAIVPNGTDFRTFGAYVPAGGTPSSAQGVAGYTAAVGTQAGATTTLLQVANSLTVPALSANDTVPMFISAQGLTCWRGVSRSLTAYATGSDLYNQGTVYGGQFARRSVRNIGGLTTSTLYVPEFVDLPLSETDLSLLTTNLYTAPAKEGLYSIHRLTGPVQDFVIPVNPSVWNSNSLLAPGTGLSLTTGLIVDSPYAQFTPALSIPVFPNYTVNPPTASPLTLNIFPSAADVNFGSTSFDSHQTWGVAIFRGLNPNMSITVKSVFALEFVPMVNSPARQFLKGPCCYDPLALSAYYAIANNLPDTVASRHNFLGTLLSGIASVASKVLPYIGQAFAPVIGDGIRNLAGMAEQKLSAQPAVAALKPPPMMPTPRPKRSVSLGSRSSIASRKVKIAKKKRK